MITRALNDMQTAFIALFLMLVPGIVLSQEQKEPVVVQPEAISESTSTPAQPERQEPAAAITPTKPDAGNTAPDTEKTAPYIIKQGDTLWDLANTFMKDPFLWPFLWKANPAITNPDLIYPGNNLTIPDLAPIERALQTSAPAGQEEHAEKQTVAEEAPIKKTAPVEDNAANQIQKQTEETTPKSTLILPEEKPIPLVDKYAMLSAGFVDEDKSSDVIVGSPEKGKTIFGYDDFVYVKMHNQENINIGDRFLIFAPMNDVTHPKTKKSYGKLIRGLGILQITAKDSPNVLTARITLSFDTIEKGNLLTPYQEPALIYRSTEKRSKDISGVILEVTDKRTISGQTDYVYLDKGSADGVDAGDRFAVYAEPDEPGFPRKKIGEVQVFLVKEHTSTAIVRISTESMTKGDVIGFKN